MQRRFLVTLIAAIMAMLSLTTATQASPTFNPVNAANLAASRQGQWGDQCKQFVNDIFREASRGEVALGGGYYSDFVKEGFGRIDPSAAWRGDVIQINVRGYGDRYEPGMHTAIVMDNLGGGWFNVVDSNWQNDEIIRVHQWNPHTYAAQRGMEVNVWRY
ncbi:hypothetical protein ABZX92_34225 [Lentzea sp. NPDC006480]|uniref:hypothetical protein n=1 Tax=Lentzea sp. NPDC006480 TaxID=3157176 RepID=UPI0033A5BEA4